MPKLLKNYSCEYCNEEGFTSIRLCKAHEVACKTRIAKEKEEKSAHDTTVAKYQELAQNARSPEEIIYLFNEFFTVITGEILNMEIQHGLCTEQQVSCSHNAPKGKERNWDQNSHRAPCWYPGFYGSVKYKPTKVSRSDFMHKYNSVFPIYTGTGGLYGIELYMFTEDFKGLTEQVQKEKLQVEKYHEAVKLNKSKLNSLIESDFAMTSGNDALKSVQNQIAELESTLTKIRQEMEKRKLELESTYIPEVKSPVCTVVSLNKW